MQKKLWTVAYDDLVALRSKTPEWRDATRRNTYGLVTTAGYTSIAEVAHAYGPCENAIDYGCGEGHALDYMQIPVFKYDPFVPGFEEYPETPADLVVAYNSINCIEDQFIGEVLSDIYSLTKRVFVVNMPHLGLYTRSLDNWVYLFNTAGFVVADAKSRPIINTEGKRARFVTFILTKRA